MSNNNVRGGWSSRYDYPNMSNLEKLRGRELHVQDNFWMVAKPLIIIVPIAVIVLLKNCEIDLSWSNLTNFLSYLKM